jgi:hypothetical protein
VTNVSHNIVQELQKKNQAKVRRFDIAMSAARVASSTMYFEYLLRTERVEEGTNALAHATATRTTVARNIFT